MCHAGDFTVIHGDAGKELGAALGLRRQHIKTACVGNAQRLRLQQQCRAGGVVDHIHHAAAVGEQAQIHGLLAVVGIHAHRRGVDDNVRVAVPVKVFVVIPAAAGDDRDFGRAQLFQHGAGSGGGAAAAQHQRFFAANGHAGVRHQTFQTERIGVVAVQGAVTAPYQRVDAADGFGGIGQLCTVGDDRLFIGNGHIQPVKAAALQKIAQLLRLFFI